MPYDLLPPLPSVPTPMVSVSMITYKHEAFIAQAIESVLMQQTNFPVELVIGEDCSPDGTRRIVLDYQRRHPKKIRLLLWHKNGGIMQNSVHTLNACRGEYIAFCEGDDYWTDPEKLQRQVAFMDAHPEMSLCHHTVDYVSWEGGYRKVLKPFPPEFDRGTRYAKDLIGNNFIQTCSLMMRRSCLPVLDTRFQSLKVGDLPLCYLAAEHGAIGFLDSCMADYRIHDSNNWWWMESEARGFEIARMFLYLADVAAAQNREAWRDMGLAYISNLLARQPTRRAACRLAIHSCRKSVLTFGDAARLLLRDMAGRAVRHHPRVRAWIKSLFPWGGYRRGTVSPSAGKPTSFP